jgi:hypothetical protein
MPSLSWPLGSSPVLAGRRPLITSRQRPICAQRGRSNLSGSSPTARQMKQPSLNTNTSGSPRHRLREPAAPRLGAKS